MRNLVLILCFASASLFAQNDRNDKIKALKTAFITERLDLSSSDAEKFWPIYNAYESKMEQLRKDERSEIILKLRDGMQTMTDSEASLLIDKSIAFKESELVNRKQLVAELKTVISSKKIIRLVKTEEDFKRRLLERMRQRRN